MSDVVAIDVAPSVAFELPTRGTFAIGALWLLSSNLLYTACQWATVVALAKLRVPSALGYFGLALAIANPVVLVIGFALKAYQSTDVLRRYAFGDYMNLRLVAHGVAVVIIAAIALTGLVDAAALAVLVPIAAAKLAEQTSETCYGLAQRLDRMRLVAIWRIARGALGLAALVIVVALGGSVAQGSWALAATWTAFLLAVELPAARRLEPVLGRSDPAVLWRLASESAPLGLVAGVLALTQSVPRFLLQLTSGVAAVGYYTALASVGPVLAQLAGAIGNAAAPRLGWAAASDGRRYRNFVAGLLGTSALITALLALGAAGAGRWFLTLAYAPDYAQYHTTLVITVLGAGFGIVNTVAYFALVAARRIRLLLAIQSLGLVITAVGCAALIPRFDLDGAALGAALGAIAMAVVGARVLLSAPEDG